jgi:hypothetical protein
MYDMPEGEAGTRQMIVTLTRKNGKTKRVVYKRTPEKIDDDIYYNICKRLRIACGELNQAGNDSRYIAWDGVDYYGHPPRSGYEPELLEITDDDGWYIEFGNEEEEQE